MEGCIKEAPQLPFYVPAMKRQQEKVLGFVVDVVGVKPTFAKTSLKRAAIVFSSEVGILHRTHTKNREKDTSDSWHPEITIWRQSPPEYAGGCTFELLQEPNQTNFFLE